MIWPPREIPEIPEAIINAAEKGKLLIFVGAGVSRLLDYPSWGQFADQLLEKLASDGHITFGEIMLLQDLDAKKKLTIAVQLAEKLVSEKYLFKFYEEKFYKDTDQNESPYKYLNELNCPFITTNYDTCLDSYRNSKIRETSKEGGESKGIEDESLPIICEPEDFNESELRTPPKTIHLHGSVIKPSSMIVTAGDYLKRYSDPSTNVQNFLSDVFKNYTVLFLGYGLDEAEILEHTLLKGNIKKTSDNKQAYKRFVLQGFYSYQRTTCEYLDKYYKETFGVATVPYTMEYKNYDQLKVVIEDWCSKLKGIIKPPLLSEDAKFLLEAMNE